MWQIVSSEMETEKTHSRTWYRNEISSLLQQWSWMSFWRKWMHVLPLCFTQCWFNESCLNPLCQYRHDISNFINESSQDDLFKHVTTITPIRANINCNIWMKVIPTGRKTSKCKECDKNVCEECAKKTYVEEDPDYFMCVKCQWYIWLSKLGPIQGCSRSLCGGIFTSMFLYQM